jgi:light-regulated signal transduction histidine kinase (bacteriophytochrome)
MDMILRPDWDTGQFRLRNSAGAATARMSVSLETLVSHLQILQDERVGSLTPEQLRFLGTAERHGVRLLQMMGDLRTVALADSGELELEWGTCDLGELACRACEQLAAAALARRKPIELRVTGTTRVLADAAQLERALLGVLEHAVEVAQGPGSITVWVRDGQLEVSYLGEPEGAHDLPLALAAAVAGLHGGALTCLHDDGMVSLVFALEAEPAESAPLVSLVA